MPPAGARRPLESPVARPFPRSGGSPGWCPFPTVNVFLRPPHPVTQEPAGIHFPVFSIHTLSTESHQLSARHSGYPPLVHNLFHRSPAVTRRIPARARPV